MGFFTLPLARLVGAGGRVVCVDIQEKMLSALKRRARRAGLADRIEARVCDTDSLGVADLVLTIDFVLAFAVVHEARNADRLFKEIQSALKPRGRVLVAEPRGHVSERAFRKTLSVAEHDGLVEIESLKIWGSHAAILERA